MVKRQAPPKPEELIKILENKFTEFKDATVAKLAEVENVSERNSKDLIDIKESVNTGFGNIRDSLETIRNDLETSVSSESKRADTNNQILQKELSDLVEDKISSLKWEVTTKLSSISEVVDFQESSSSRILSQLEDHISWKMKNISQELQQEMKNISMKAQIESKSQDDAKEQIGCLAAMIDEINEKLYDFEASKRNNLIFYGIQGEHDETPLILQEKVAGL